MFQCAGAPTLDVAGPSNKASSAQDVRGKDVARFSAHTSKCLAKKITQGWRTCADCARVFRRLHVKIKMHTAIERDKNAGKNNERFQTHAVSVAGFSGPEVTP